jgi:hypothetical protein
MRQLLQIVSPGRAPSSVRRSRSNMEISRSTPVRKAGSSSGNNRSGSRPRSSSVTTSSGGRHRYYSDNAPSQQQQHQSPSLAAVERHRRRDASGGGDATNTSTTENGDLSRVLEFSDDDRESISWSPTSPSSPSSRRRNRHDRHRSNRSRSVTIRDGHHDDNDNDDNIDHRLVDADRDREALGHARAEIERRTTELKTLTLQLTSKDQELEQQRTTMVPRTDFDGIHAKLVTAERELQRRTQHLEHSNGKMEELKTKLSTARTRIDELETLQRSHEAAITSLRDDAAKGAMVDGLQRTINQLKESEKEWQTEKQELEHQRSLTVDETRQLQLQLTAAMTTVTLTIPIHITMSPGYSQYH